MEVRDLETEMSAISTKQDFPYCFIINLQGIMCSWVTELDFNKIKRHSNFSKINIYESGLPMN